MDRVYLNCKGLSCPLPIVNIGRSLRKLEVGQLIEIEADDPAFKDDVMAYIRQTCHTILSMEEGPITKVVIRKER